MVVESTILELFLMSQIIPNTIRTYISINVLKLCSAGNKYELLVNK